MDCLPIRAKCIVNLMKTLNTANRTSTDELDFCEEKTDDLLKELHLTYEEIWDSVSEDFREEAVNPKLTPEWKFMCISFYYLKLLKEQLAKNFMINGQDIRLLCKCVENMIDIGISQNILPSLPFYKPLRKVDIAVVDKFHMLKASVLGLYFHTFRTSLHGHLFQSYLSQLLVGLFQLGYCPVKKPSDKEHGTFVMTNDFYDEVIVTQSHCQEILSVIRKKVLLPPFILSLSKLMKPSNPRWFTEVIVSNLNITLTHENGIRALLILMNGIQTKESSDKPVVVLGRLVSMTSQTEDFELRILPQINFLLRNEGDKGEIFLFGEILKHTYKSDIVKGCIILETLLFPFKELVRNSGISSTKKHILPFTLKNGIKVISYAFLNSIDKLPMKLIKNYVGILFNIYMFLEDSNSLLLKDLRSILIEYFNDIDKSESFQLLENLLFDMGRSEYYSPLYKLDIRADKNNLKISFDEKNLKYDILLSARSILSLFKHESDLKNLYFTFLLSCLVDSKKYFPDVSLLVAEDEGYLSTFERKLAVFEMLNLLASSDTVKKYFRENIPEELLNYFNELFKNAIQTGAHNNPEHDDYQSIFTIAIVLQQVFNGKSCSLKGSEFRNTVKLLHDETNNDELKKLLNPILEEHEVEQSIPTEVDEVEENVQFVLSENIETQGHGLIMLKKMIISRHPQAVERKQFIFTIFKERLAHRDTYIYLAAINGLASFADLGTESTSMVLNTLCEEYRDFPTEEFGPDATEMRLKVGEVLVKVSTKLGEMAPHYKALLLNTFLCGTKDEDHFVRTSALSNLGEICKVLGYKLGSIVTEILVCVNGILNSDKHKEPRRAAVFVIRQLLVGLGKDMLSILKDDILVVYRTLKFLHFGDEDHVLRLQCELAIKEVDNNMKEILVPQIELNKTEKVVVLR
ncbi:uncharacterized protein LOC123311212 [Coccinella septempunctata]|uniref:uncharacterized protein LOC123311212 n=1 Tax=Coccinella septempunctata TaxID=41139 RepID=UPI001D07215D|nr:uncharacterized protein LOC123311212 [Coccinella septempunctata]